MISETEERKGELQTQLEHFIEDYKNTVAAVKKAEHAAAVAKNNAEKSSRICRLAKRHRQKEKESEDDANILP